jgi:hypothetical protein
MKTKEYNNSRPVFHARAVVWAVILSAFLYGTIMVGWFLFDVLMH